MIVINHAINNGRISILVVMFSRETNLPLTLGLLIDTSMSQRRVLGEERTASYHFLEQVLREDKDQAFVIHRADHGGQGTRNVDNPAALREYLTYDANGNFRALRTGTDLRGGWRVGPLGSRVPDVCCFPSGACDSE